jgi:acyl-CoA thioesterase-1
MNKRTRGIRSWVAVSGLAVVCAAALAAGVLARTDAASAAEPKLPNGIRVMTLGSSVAEGWDDKIGGGYLKRTIVHMAKVTGYPYVLVNRAFAGNTSVQVMPQYVRWLRQVKPQIVIVSWGGLDDAHAKTPIPAFRHAVYEQIEMALHDHAVVWVVTPPVTRASYTEYKVQEPLYLDNEMAVAQGMKSPNVYVFDVFDQMKAYLVAHHQTYVPYMADGWHPNSAGDALAAKLLIADETKVFGLRKITFVDPSKRT